jgi:hypothetical protein
VSLYVSGETLLVTWADGSPAYGHAIPPPLWTAVLAEVERQGLTLVYRKAFAEDLAKVEEGRALNLRWSSLDEHEAEERLFRRVVEKVYGPQTIWPWQEGWTQELADSYPVREARRAA